jgi:L-aspartate oxidase
MLADHPLAELAPRDVVARSIQRQMAIDSDKPVYLDLRHLNPGLVRMRFPTIAERLHHYGLDLSTDLIPVAPAAHYFIGGVVANTVGETLMDGLLALGEVSCTGVHGANRLASNSLLEGLVFGLRAADQINESTIEQTRLGDHPVVNPPNDGMVESALDDGSVIEVKRSIQQIMSSDVAVVRSAASLDDALARLSAFETDPSLLQGTRHAFELRNLLLLAREVASAALEREESRGGHYREDFPNLQHALDGRHQVVRLDRGAFLRSFLPLHAPAAIEHTR